MAAGPPPPHRRRPTAARYTHGPHRRGRRRPSSGPPPSSAGRAHTPAARRRATRRHRQIRSGTQHPAGHGPVRPHPRRRRGSHRDGPRTGSIAGGSRPRPRRHRTPMAARARDRSTIPATVLVERAPSTTNSTGGGIPDGRPVPLGTPRRSERRTDTATRCSSSRARPGRALSDIDVRRLAEAAAVDASTVSRRLRVLRAEGWVTCVKRPPAPGQRPGNCPTSDVAATQGEPAPRSSHALLDHHTTTSGPNATDWEAPQLAFTGSSQLRGTAFSVSCRSHLDLLVLSPGYTVATLRRVLVSSSPPAHPLADDAHANDARCGDHRCRRHRGPAIAPAPRRPGTTTLGNEEVEWRARRGKKRGVATDATMLSLPIAAPARARYGRFPTTAAGARTTARPATSSSRARQHGPRGGRRLERVWRLDQDCSSPTLGFGAPSPGGSVPRPLVLVHRSPRRGTLLPAAVERSPGALPPDPGQSQRWTRPTSVSSSALRAPRTTRQGCPSTSTTRQDLPPPPRPPQDERACLAPTGPGTVETTPPVDAEDKPHPHLT